VLTPDELAGLLRIGEALANISERLSAIMGRPGGPLPAELRQLAVIAIDLLNVVEPDPDLEPDGGEEPSLGWSVDGATASGNDFHNLDAEEDIADQPHDAEQAEDLVQPIRLDVFPRPLFIGAHNHD
jgi:hypothetical protein